MNDPLMKNEPLCRLYDSGILSHMDVHFARFMARLADTPNPELCLAAALVSSFTRQGHICLDLAALAGKPLPETTAGGDPIVCPTWSDWQKKLREAAVVGNPGEYKPLILDNRARLYLYRYWDYQEKLANLILRRVGQDAGDIDTALLQEGLVRLFSQSPTSCPPKPSEGLDWQRVAAILHHLRWPRNGKNHDSGKDLGAGPRTAQIQKASDSPGGTHRKSRCQVAGSRCPCQEQAPL
jgi:exodeoxyribonuclease V alpha subunit